jgi:hypothetical protein
MKQSHSEPDQPILELESRTRRETNSPENLPGVMSVFDENGSLVAYRDAKLGWWYNPDLNQWQT